MASIGGGNITSLRFADIDALGEEEQKLEALVRSLNKTFTRYKIEDQIDDQQHSWHPKGYQVERTETGYCIEL